MPHNYRSRKCAELNSAFKSLDFGLKIYSGYKISECMFVLCEYDRFDITRAAICDILNITDKPRNSTNHNFDDQEPIIGENAMENERFVSLKVKITIGVILICFLIGLLAILSVNRIATTIVDKEYGDKAEQVSEAVVNIIDPADVYELNEAVMNVYYSVDKVVPSTEWGSDEWNEYMSNYEGIDQLPVFIKLRDQFRVYQDIFNIDCIYITQYKNEIKNAIYIVDGAPDEDACPPGCVDAFEDGIWPEKDDPLIPATITNEDVYGWLVCIKKIKDMEK